MTEEQRLEDLKLNPRVVTNKQEKGKMKFLQKYYHRGAFYMDEENDLMKVKFRPRLWTVLSTTPGRPVHVHVRGPRTTPRIVR